MVLQILISYHITTRCHNPEDNDINLHHSGNLKFCRPRLCVRGVQTLQFTQENYSCRNKKFTMLTLCCFLFCKYVT
jgi:hypothetical protein